MKRFFAIFLSALIMLSLLVPMSTAMAATTTTSISVTGSNDATSGKVKLTWKAVKNAKKYEVYRSGTRNGTYSKMSTTTNLSYTNTSANAGYTYYYKVKALNSSGKVLSTSSVVCRTCDCAAPSISIGNEAASGKISLTWGKVSGASKYEVYRSDSRTGTFKKQLTTTKTSYVNNTAEPGDTYYYKVKAIASRTSDANSAYSTIKARTCDCPAPSISSSNNAETGKIVIKWKAVDGASKYEVYRSGTKNGTYTKYYTTTSTSYTNTSANAGSTYYYKVKAIASNSDANSAFSSIISRTCDCPAIVRAKTSIDYTDEGKLIFKWEKVSGATGYKVYRAPAKCVTVSGANADEIDIVKNGDYKLLKTVTTNSFTDTEAKVGNYYYYKLVAVNSKSSYADSAAIESPAYPLYPKAQNLRVSSTLNAGTLRWDAIKGVQGYIILVGNEANFDTMQPVDGIGSITTTYTGTDIVKGKWYCVIGIKDMGQNENPLFSVPAFVQYK